MYIGKADNLFRRLGEHVKGKKFDSFEFYEMPNDLFDEEAVLSLESYLIMHFSPPYNTVHAFSKQVKLSSKAQYMNEINEKIAEWLEKKKPWNDLPKFCCANCMHYGFGTSIAEYWGRNERPVCPMGHMPEPNDYCSKWFLSDKKDEEQKKIVERAKSYYGSEFPRRVPKALIEFYLSSMDRASIPDITEEKENKQ